METKETLVVMDTTLGKIKFKFRRPIAECSNLPAAAVKELKVIRFFKRYFPVKIQTAGNEQALDLILKKSCIDRIKAGFSLRYYKGPFNPLPDRRPVVASVLAADIVDKLIFRALRTRDSGASVILSIYGAGGSRRIKFRFEENAGIRGSLGITRRSVLRLILFVC